MLAMMPLSDSIAVWPARTILRTLRLFLVSQLLIKQLSYTLTSFAIPAPIRRAEFRTANSVIFQVQDQCQLVLIVLQITSFLRLTLLNAFFAPTRRMEGGMAASTVLQVAAQMLFALELTVKSFTSMAQHTHLTPAVIRWKGSSVAILALTIPQTAHQ
jgi:hypothetical protein